MRIAVYGSGAVGGLLGARLLEGEHEVHFIARGKNLHALRTSGLRVCSSAFGDRRYQVHAHGSAAEIGPVDYVLLGVKASALPRIAALVEPLKGQHTTFVSLQNGLPWWYFHGVPGHDEPIQAVDPDGAVARHIPAGLVVGAIVYFSCELERPGVVLHTVGNRLPLGEPTGGSSDRVAVLADALRAVGFKAPVRHDIRHELWVKLLGNGALNPLSALTRKSLEDLLESPDGLRLIGAMMDEIREVAAAVGVRIALSNDRRLAGARAAGHHRTSMLQDLDQGREPELDALLGAVIELADRNHVPVPALQAIYGAAKVLFDRPVAVAERVLGRDMQ